MGKIQIWHGIYDIIFDTAYQFNGYFNEETRQYLPMSNKLKTYLSIKGLKFNGKYDYTELFFTLGRDPENHIEAIAVCHPYYDDIDFKIAEDIVIGRIKRMRGDIKEIIYEHEDYEIDIPLYIDKIGVTHFRTITRKRVKMDEHGEPIIQRAIYYKPYNLDRRYRIKRKDGAIVAGELMYPYIWKMESSRDHQSIADMMIDNYMSGEHD